MIWHISWHCIWHFSAILSDILLDIFMTCDLISISHIFWHSISHVLTSYLTVYLTFHLAFYLAMCSGPAAQRVGELADWQTHLPWRGGGKFAGCTWLGVCVCGHVCGRVSPGCLVNLKNLTGGEWSYTTSGSWETSVPNPSIGWSSFLRMAMAFFWGTPHWQTNPVGPEFAHIYAKAILREMNGEIDLTGLAMTTGDSRDINHQRNGMW